MADSLKIITTEDGSHSLYNTTLNETYHSFHGAVQESKYVFLKQGLDYFVQQNSPNKIRVFEMGFGTGLNALLSYQWAVENKIIVEFNTIEAFPVPVEQAETLNYVQLLQDESLGTVFSILHQLPWEAAHELHQYFKFHKWHGKIENRHLGEDQFDVIFFDAFAPNKQGEVWGLPILESIANSMAAQGVFVTYCAQGQLKRNLKSLALEVQTVPGPPGKKEMVRASKLL